MRHLSGGQKQRLALGAALINNPDLVFLDEPTTGLDPQARRNIWAIVERLKGEGKTIVLTTHYMEEAEALSDEVCIMDHGRVIAHGSPRDLTSSLGQETLIEFDAFDLSPEALASLPGGTRGRDDGDPDHVRSGGGAGGAPLLVPGPRGSSPEHGRAPAEPGGRVPLPHREKAPRVRAVLQLARCSLGTALREKETLFWFVVFPLLLLSVLTLVFGHLGEEGTMNFTVALANLDREEGFASVVEEVFVSLSVPPQVGKEPLLTLRQPTSGEDAERFLAREREAVRLGDVAALIVIPPGFSSAALAALVGSGSPASLAVYSSDANAASTMAADVVEQVLARLNRELLTGAGLYRPEAATPVHTEWIGEASAPVAYVDFLLPGIVLMAFFVGGLFSVSGTILFSRDLKILRRYWVTPSAYRSTSPGSRLGTWRCAGSSSPSFSSSAGWGSEPRWRSPGPWPSGTSSWRRSRSSRSGSSSLRSPRRRSRGWPSPTSSTCRSCS